MKLAVYVRSFARPIGMAVTADYLRSITRTGLFLDESKGLLDRVHHARLAGTGLGLSSGARGVSAHPAS